MYLGISGLVVTDLWWRAGLLHRGQHGLRRLVGGGRRPRRPERLEPLIELMLRPLRGTATPAEVSVARVILANLRDMAEWNRPGWRPSTLDLAELRAAAGQELADAAARRTTRTPGWSDLSCWSWLSCPCSG
jgi:hypothetical protein